MIVGHNHHRLEKRIAMALLNGEPSVREAIFLQQMSRHILHRGKDAWLSDRQAAWLFAILNHSEMKNAPLTKPPPSPHQPKSEPGWKKPEAIDIEDCLVDPQSTSQQSLNQSNAIVPPISTEPAQATKAGRTHGPDMASILKQALAKNENLRKRQERLERRYLKS